MDDTQREAAEWEIEQMLASAADDGDRLARLTEYIAEHHGKATVARERRNAIAGEMRARGVPMQDIAKMAGVDDSYLARVLLKAGMEPRLRRGNRS